MTRTRREMNLFSAGTSTEDVGVTAIMCSATINKKFLNAAVGIPGRRSLSHGMGTPQSWTDGRATPIHS